MPGHGNCADHSTQSENVAQHSTSQSAEQLRAKDNSNDLDADITELVSTQVIGQTDGIVCHQRIALRHGQPVKRIVQCWHSILSARFAHNTCRPILWCRRDVVVGSDDSD